MSASPVILAVNGDADALARIEQELRRRYERDYRILTARHPYDALARLEGIHSDDGQVALVLADLACTDLLGRVAQLYPGAKRGLLIPWGGWGDEETAKGVRDAMLHGRIDYYVLEPWASPDEYFHRTVTELLTEWQRAKQAIRREVTLVADPEQQRTRELLTVLARHGVPYGFYYSGSEEGRRLLTDSGKEDPSAPVVFLRDGSILDDPSEAELAAHGYRLPTELEKPDYDVVVVGAGPAGLTSGVYASSEGLETLVVEPATIGGQAGASSRIRNYLGFPRGLSGSELAQRAYQQAWVFGTSFLLTRAVEALSPREDGYVLALSGDEEVRARSVVLAMGITYRRLGIPAEERLREHGVFYAASPQDAQALAGRSVVVVGGGNSAGQAAVHLGRYAERVTMAVRGRTLASSMSQYLQDEIDARTNIQVLYETEVMDASGDSWIEGVALRTAAGETQELPADALFVLVGGHPHTGWLPETVTLDAGGYVVTDENLGEAWPLERLPHMYETSVPGVFAVGDVRSHSVKRVAAAVGEGSVVIHQVHRYLESEERPTPARHVRA